MRASRNADCSGLPYVAKFLKRHYEFADITDPVTPRFLRWLKAQLG
ncbi:hypothetical protein SVIOM342S_01693 [Streptomyces violaceorubidus]